MKRPVPVTTPRPAVGYVRVSTEEQAREGLSLDAQEQAIRAYAKVHGLNLTDVLVEAGGSGKSMDRPQLQLLLGRARERAVGTVVVYRLDRLTRRTRDLLELTEDVFKPLKVDLVSLSEQLDTRTPAGLLMLTLFGALAQMERELIGERTRLALGLKKSRGDRLGTTPLGFTTPGPGVPMEPLSAELEVVRILLRLRRRGKALREIADTLNEAGYPTKRGGQWHASTVRLIIQRRSTYLPHLR